MHFTGRLCLLISNCWQTTVGTISRRKRRNRTHDCIVLFFILFFIFHNARGRLKRFRRPRALWNIKNKIKNKTIQSCVRLRRLRRLIVPTVVCQQLEMSKHSLPVKCIVKCKKSYTNCILQRRRLSWSTQRFRRPVGLLGLQANLPAAFILQGYFFGLV